jgi:DNA primase large subunit
LSIRLGTQDLAKYPFLNEASEYVRETNFDIAEFDRPEMEYIINRATYRIETEIFKGKIFYDLEKYEIEILTFLASLLIVRRTGIDSIYKKYSLFEAMRAEKFLTNDLQKQKSSDKRKLLLFKIFKELFNFEIEIEPQDTRIFRMSVPDYLSRSSKINEQEWKLINRLVTNGHVYLDVDETVRLIRSELSSLIYNRIKNMQSTNILNKIDIKTNEIKKKYLVHFPAVRYKITEYPPCIKHVLEICEKGENLPHSARFLLATYLLSIGKSIDETIVPFKNLPDFNEKITKYQVEHLAGIKGSFTKYSVPSCKKLQIENLCFATRDCYNIINPIQFRKRVKE